MLSDSAALVLFAIRSAITLGRQMRRAYVDSTRRRELILPLPNFFSSPDISSATNYFAGPGRAYAAQVPRLAELLHRRQTAGQDLTPDEEREVLTYHTEFFNLDRARDGKLGTAADGSTLTAREFNALITIRQWRRGADPDPSTLQRLAGTFIEIGIDYFVNVPGALNTNSRQGKALAGFLQGMSQIRFSEEQLGEVPGRLFIAALETIAERIELLSADAKVQELVKVTTTALSTDVVRRLAQLRASGTSDLVKEERVADWAELVFRSLLSSAGGLVLSQPRRFLGVEGEGQAALVSRVGESVLGLVLDDSDLRLDRLFSRDGLETITKSALAVVGEHPEILLQSRNAGLQALLSAIATELSRYDTLLTPDVLPELTRLILDRTGENLALLWPDLARNPQQHLLLTAAGTTLEILTRKAAGGQKWAPRFGRADLLAVVEMVFQELISNPTWLLDEAGRVNDNLKIALDAALGALRSHADERLSPASAVRVLRTVVLTVGSRQEFLDKMPAGAALAGQPLIAAVLDAIFRAVFDEHLDARAAWQVVRSVVMVDLVNAILARLARVRLVPDSVAALTAFIRQWIESLAAGEAWDLPTFEAGLRDALAPA